MDFTTAVSTCFKKYATFSGRASRSEYWYFMLFSFLGGFVIGFLEGFIAGMQGHQAKQIASVLFQLAILLPSITVTTRRIHDLNFSGWWQLAWIVAAIVLCVIVFSLHLGFLNSLFALVFVGLLPLLYLAKKGTDGDNRFGSDPLQKA